MSLKIEKHEKIAMLAVSTLNSTSSLISKALSDNSLSDEEYSLILLEFETFTPMKEDLRIKSKPSLEKTGNIETKVSVLIEIRQLHRLEHMFKPMFKNRVQNRVENNHQNRVQNHDPNRVQTVLKNAFEIMFQKLKI